MEENYSPTIMFRGTPCIYKAKNNLSKNQNGDI